jgi:hypothetical protein
MIMLSARDVAMRRGLSTVVRIAVMTSLSGRILKRLIVCAVGRLWKVGLSLDRYVASGYVVMR